MTTYTKETALYDTGAIGDGIDAAGETASKYITVIDQNGIKVHAENNPTTNYTQIDGNGMEVFEGGTSVASFGTNGARLGENTGAHSEIDADGQRFYGGSDGTTQLANIGYGKGNGESGISTNPYFTFGQRKTTTTNYSSKSYNVGDLCIYNNTMYVCIVAIPYPEAWNEEHWDVAIGNYSFAEGYRPIASGYASHAEGEFTLSFGKTSHAEGGYTIANGQNAHAEGYETQANNWASHAEGIGTIASGEASHAQNYFTIAQRASQTVIGECNIADTGGADESSRGDYVFIIGNGTGTSAALRSNALTVDWSGNVEAAGELTVQGHDTPIGTYKGGATGSSYSSSVSASTSWQTVVGDSGSDYNTASNRTLTAGVYLVTGTLRIIPNTSQRQYGACLRYSSDGGDTYNTIEGARHMICSSGTKALTLNVAHTFVVPEGNTYRVALGTYHEAAGTLTYAFIRSTRIA